MLDAREVLRLARMMIEQLVSPDLDHAGRDDGDGLARSRRRH